MPGVAQHSESFKTSQKTASSGLSQGALTHAFVMANNTGRASRDLDGWLQRGADRVPLAASTERFADVLEQQGIQARLDVDLTAVGLITGKAEKLVVYRNTNVLPVVSSRNRADGLRQLEFFMEHHPMGPLLRYGVVTFGQRLEPFSGLRERVQEKQRAISKVAHWAKKKYGIHFVYRHGELTVDENLSIHAHSNILYYLEEKLSKERWAQFKWEAAQKFGARWEDNGRVRKASEVVKYFVKGDDLTLLADMACAVPEWADGDFDVMGLAEEVARRLAAKVGKKEGRYVEPMEYFGRGLEHVRGVVSDLRARAVAGAPHPLVWLFNEMFGLRIATAMDDFRAFRRGVREERAKIAGVDEADGRKLRKVERQRREQVEECAMAKRLGPDEVCPMRKLCQNCPMDRARFDVLMPENEVLSLTLPQPRFSPYSEPTALVRNYRPKPRTMLGALHADRMERVGRYYRRYWDASGAPDPAQVLSAVAAAGGPLPFTLLR